MVADHHSRHVGLAGMPLHGQQMLANPTAQPGERFQHLLDFVPIPASAVVEDLGTGKIGHGCDGGARMDRLSQT